MNISVRDFSMLGYTMAISNYILDKSDDEKLKWRVKKVDDAARDIAKIYKGDGDGNLLTPRKVKQINTQVERLITKLPRIGDGRTQIQKKNLVVNCAFLLCILDEIFKKSKNKTLLERFEVLHKRIVWCNAYVDTKLDRFGSYILGENIFNEWVK